MIHQSASGAKLMWYLWVLGLALAALLVSRRLISPQVVGFYAVLGSGGHTGEMLRIIESIDLDLRPTHYILGRNDRLSMEKLASAGLNYKRIICISRPRNVGQSYVTSVFTTIRTVMECLSLFRTSLPKLVQCCLLALLCITLH